MTKFMSGRADALLSALPRHASGSVGLVLVKRLSHASLLLVGRLTWGEGVHQLEYFVNCDAKMEAQEAA